jgi:hypothetical protein
LRWSVRDLDDDAPTGSHLQAYELAGPELAVSERAALINEDFVAPEQFCAWTVGDAFESHLGPFFAPTQVTNGVRVAVDRHHRSRFEVDQMLGLDVKTKEPIETVGFAQTADPVVISRGIRLQR